MHHSHRLRIENTRADFIKRILSKDYIEEMSAIYIYNDITHARPKVITAVQGSSLGKLFSRAGKKKEAKAMKAR